ncbi:Minichromosome maintenance deficient 8 [Zopfochytrium polystomum]|nr:Minichromosome maintenance deficient 8 [Zopfochytrium polystomum]
MPPNPTKRPRDDQDHFDDELYSTNSGGGTGRANGVQRRRRTASECPYPEWVLYFPDEPFSEDHDLIPMITGFMDYFNARFGEEIEDTSAKGFRSRTIVEVDYQDLRQKCKVGDIDLRLQQQPNDVLSSMGLAACLVANRNVDMAEDGADFIKKTVRILKYDNITALKELKANLMGRFIAVKGTVVRVSSIKPLVTVLAFSCSSCQTIQEVKQIDGKFKPPVRCTMTGCRGKNFAAERSSPQTVTSDWQRIRIQEKLPDNQLDSGRIPRTVECELTDDLVDLVMPGDVVCVSGVVKTLTTDEGKGKKNTQMFYLYIWANSLIKASSNSGNEEEQESTDAGFSKDSIAFSDNDLRGIERIYSLGPKIFKALVNSLCPAIFGHEMVKAGLLLTLLGGRHRSSDESKDIAMRSNPHMLIVGDPGLGKSQMLSATVKTAARGVYICGNTATSSGLTVTLCKDGETGETALEAGALVLGDRGICCIDEFDKLTEHQALLEAMEQQSISIAKAGMVCTLPARTSVIAAANPVGGHYNKAKTVSENLKMNAALLSRFDLVFILLDKPDEEMDMFLSDHIMRLHSGQIKSDDSTNKGWGFRSEQTRFDTVEQTLIERLRMKRSDVFDPLPHSLLRKYIAFARKNIHPVLTEEAALVLRDFYLTLRNKYRSIDSTPITTRQLESMIRLAEARAKCDLRDHVTKEDAEDVVAVMKFSLWDTYQDNLGNIDFQRSQLGTGSSKRGEPKKFISYVSKIAMETGIDRFNLEQLHQMAKDIGIRVDDFRDFVESLNNQGYLLKKGPRLYTVSTVQ